MTRRDFELIAQVIADTPNVTWQCRATFAMAFAHRLAQDWPAFDRARFLRACDVRDFGMS